MGGSSIPGQGHGFRVYGLQLCKGCLHVFAGGFLTGVTKGAGSWWFGIGRFRLRAFASGFLIQGFRLQGLRLFEPLKL